MIEIENVSFALSSLTLLVTLASYYVWMMWVPQKLLGLGLAPNNPSQAPLHSSPTGLSFSLSLFLVWRIPLLLPPLHRPHSEKLFFLSSSSYTDILAFVLKKNARYDKALWQVHCWVNQHVSSILALLAPRGCTEATLCFAKHPYSFITW